jgi:Tol biopolymer transport system component
MVLMAYDRRADLALHRIDSDGERCEIGATLHLRNQSLSWCGPSPDGEWLACTTRGAQEDIVLVRADGSQSRRLTDDPDKDRAAEWSPDGERIHFLSTRSGDWEHWSINVDGSDLRQLTDLGELAEMVLSPDGRQGIVNANYFDEVWRVDLDRLNTRDDAERLAIGVAGFYPQAWSPDGARVAGTELDDSGRPLRFGVIELTSASYRELGPAISIDDTVAGWLPDSRRLILRAGSEVLVHDTASGERRTLLTLGGARRAALALNATGRVLLVEETLMDSEIWLLSFEAR